ncbi:molybdenum ABC transporter permease [Epilithonimonas sp.]|uniref:molybdenum ABC transporter permease n=1 Tax=Epilithonimonas sp. TaxID=2894511 RepID=UPI0028AD043D|nr:molybdenum ABC transporter permease [Epilithonimonas sp.]
MDVLFIAINSLVLGFILKYWINRRRFNRRGAAGIEGFNSYESALWIKMLERLGKWLAYALILFGLFFLWRYSRANKTADNHLSTVYCPENAYSI